MHLWLRDTPGQRTLILLTSTEDESRGLPPRALVFRPGRGSQAVVEFLRKSDVDRDGLIKLSSRPVEGCLGLINVEGDIFLIVVNSATVVGNIRPSAVNAEVVSRIHEIAFYCLNSSRFDGPYDDAPSTPSSFDAVDSILSRDQQSYNSFAASSQPSIYEHPCAPLKKILSSGTFYYAPYPYWDLSSRLSERLKRQRNGMNIHDMATFDSRFIWNEYIARSLLDFRERLSSEERNEFDRCQFLILAIQGYVGVFPVALPAPPSSGSPVIGTIGLISRLGWKRAGTRFNTRGVDDEGNVANFVESETIFSTSETTFSYIQVRGSVPLFWEQQGIQTFGHRIQITRPPQATQPAFERHFAQLIDEYGAVHVINLLGQKEGETLISSAYNQHLQNTIHATGDYADIGVTNFDFHGEVRMRGHDSLISTVPRLDGVRRSSEHFGFLTCSFDSDEPIMEQRGIFRTNCLDCLDRTNFIQDIISRTTLEQFLLNINQSWVNSGGLWTSHRELWAESGDALSKIYAGTGALNTSITRTGKRTFAGVLADATKSVSRAYINNFQDKGKQTAIDMFLGNISSQPQVLIFDPIHDSVRAALRERVAEYSTRKTLRIFAGTYNLNGRPPSEPLHSWLFPESEKDAPSPDILVVGFQEIVPLNAQQIIQADPAKKREWEAQIQKTIETRGNYLIFRSEQLVGTALFVIVKSELAGALRNVEAATRKTGLRGMAGNKGAVAIRFDYYDTSFCFLTAHLAAGHTNVIERNNDYHTIDSGLRFSKGRNIKSHDVVVWAADTNYRVDLENPEVRSYATSGNLQPLIMADQLIDAMHANDAFSSYQEGDLTFPPTYRYDLHSDNYDTSEKQRIPAWTDRILYRGLPMYLRLTSYSRAELRGSDHRPVYAIFKSDVLVIDVAKKNALQEEILRQLTATDADELLEEKLSRTIIDDSFSDDLPPPSSAETCWWKTPENPDGIFSADFTPVLSSSTNPFDSDATSAASSSEEELYRQVRPIPTTIPS